MVCTAITIQQLVLNHNIESAIIKTKPIQESTYQITSNFYSSQFLLILKPESFQQFSINQGCNIPVYLHFRAKVYTFISLEQ